MDSIVRCSNCSFENPATARFCENCGQPLQRGCPNCGQPVSATAKFCGNCGFNLAGVGGAPAPSLASLHQAAPKALKDKIRAGPRLEGERASW